MDSIGLGDLLAVMNQKDNDGYGWGAALGFGLLSFSSSLLSLVADSAVMEILVH